MTDLQIFAFGWWVGMFVTVFAIWWVSFRLAPDPDDEHEDRVWW